MPADTSAAVSVGGLVALTMTDYPGQLAAALFLQGCPWRCVYCHNPHLQGCGTPTHAWDSIRGFLSRRRGLLDAVVFSGGEPTAQPGLADALGEVREMGFLTGLHTGGIYPRRLADVLPLVDWVGLDIKAAPPDYGRVTGCGPTTGARAFESLQLVLQRANSYEVRTTVHPDWLDEASTLTLGLDLAAMGVAHYALQEYRAPRGPATDTTPPHEPLSLSLIHI